MVGSMTAKLIRVIYATKCTCPKKEVKFITLYDNKRSIVVFRRKSAYELRVGLQNFTHT